MLTCLQITILRLYLAKTQAGPSFVSGLKRPAVENLGPRPARPSGLGFRPKPSPTMQKPIGPQARPLRLNTHVSSSRPAHPGIQAQIRPRPGRGQGRAGPGFPWPSIVAAEENYHVSVDCHGTHRESAMHVQEVAMLQ